MKRSRSICRGAGAIAGAIIGIAPAQGQAQTDPGAASPPAEPPAAEAPPTTPVREAPLPAEAPSAPSTAPAKPRPEKTEKPPPKGTAAARRPAPSQTPQSGFHFGSYGRIVAASDLRRRPGRDAELVAHGSRLDESNYVELELRRDDYWAKTASTTRLVATLAAAHPVFHYNGVFDAKLAVRNLYLEESGLGIKALSVWAGSRMYRGDDIYLFDWWPLDNLNTLGAGARYEFGKRTSAALHGGLSQPETGFFGQSVARPAPLNQIGATDVKVLDRQKFTGSLKMSHTLPLGKTGGLRAIAYTEIHEIPSGQRQVRAPDDFETLPWELGYVLGAQIGVFTGKQNTHANLFVRYAGGLAAYGDLATPKDLGPDKTTAGAREFLVALEGNWETGMFGLMLGAYIRTFRNASPDLDYSDLDEGIVAVRPHLFFGELGGVAVEASYQAIQRGVVSIPKLEQGDPIPAPTGPHTGNLFRLGLVPFLSPAGRGNFTRPHIRLMYVLTARSEGARALYPQDDVFSFRALDHFLGVGAEWWFNSLGYGG